MADISAVPQAGTAPLSTTLDQGISPLGTGGGKPDLSEPKPESVGDTLKGEIARIRGEEAKEAEAKAPAKEDAEPKKTEVEKEKQARSEKGQFAKAKSESDEPDTEARAKQGEPEKAAVERAETDKSRQSEGQKHHEPPARFLPKAKEVYANVPHAVKGEIARMVQDHDAEITKYREAGERYEPIRQYDDIARQNGRKLSDSLGKVVEIEQALARNPIAGLEAVLREVGPRKADGSHVNLMDVLKYVSENPDAYRQTVNQSRPQHRQPDPEVAQLKQEIQSMRAEQATQAIITPFAAQNPRFQELQDDIAFFLESGKIPASLTPQERLEAAYDMAVRINPTSSVAPSQARETLVVAKPVPSDNAGTRSIRGAPNGQDPDDDDPDTNDRVALLRRELRKAVA